MLEKGLPNCPSPMRRLALCLQLGSIRKPEMSHLRCSQHLRRSGGSQGGDFAPEVTHVTHAPEQSPPWEPPEHLKCCEHPKRDISGFLTRNWDRGRFIIDRLYHTRYFLLVVNMSEDSALVELSFKSAQLVVFKYSQKFLRSDRNSGVWVREKYECGSRTDCCWHIWVRNRGTPSPFRHRRR